MCTHATHRIAVRGAAKGPQGWIRISDATVYFDHPVHATDTHTLNIDLSRPSEGVGARVAVELSAASARELAGTILAALDAVPAELRDPSYPALTPTDSRTSLALDRREC